MIKNKLLEKYLTRRLSQPTVILCFKVLLDNIINNGSDSRMTKAEINKAFDEQNKSFGVQTFRSDYLLRQSGATQDNAIGVDPDGNSFFIRSTFLEGLDNNDFLNIRDYIMRHFEDLHKKKRELYNEILDVLKASIEERKKFILFMLLEKETEKKGQCFEVTAFSILKTFYSIRGFELNRFSTIYSNDGGIDYTSQTSIYQVTTKLTDNKFDDDIEKAPMKSRIFVYREASTNFNFNKLDNELVSDFIDSNDLIEHLNYLLHKKPEINSNKILNTILKEFEREYYM